MSTNFYEFPPFLTNVDQFRSTSTDFDQFRRIFTNFDQFCPILHNFDQFRQILDFQKIYNIFQNLDTLQKYIKISKILTNHKCKFRKEGIFGGKYTKKNIFFDKNMKFFGQTEILRQKNEIFQ